MPSEFKARFPNTRRAAAFARRSLIAHVAGYGYGVQELADIETAVGEALANAAEHGHRAESGFDVRVYVERGRVVIEIQDDGSGFTPPSGERRAVVSDAPRGFGHLPDAPSHG